MPLPRNVLCGLDLSGGDVVVAPDALSDSSAAALDASGRLCRAGGGRLHLLAALDLDDAAESLVARESAAGRRTLADAARERLEAVAAGPRAAGIGTTTSVTFEPPAASLVADAVSEGRDLIVAGTRERGALARNLLGSTALSLLRRSPVDVMIARPRSATAAGVVLAVVDLGDMAPGILSMAAELAAAEGAALHVLHVVDCRAEEVLRAGAADEEFIREYRKKRRARAEAEVPALVAAATAAARPAGVVVHLPDGDVVPAILRTAEDGKADVVVLGSVVHSLASAAFTGLGRTAEGVLPRLQSSLFVRKPVRGPVPQAAGEPRRAGEAGEGAQSGEARGSGGIAAQ